MKILKLDIFINVQNGNSRKVLFRGIPVFRDSLINAVKIEIEIME